MRVSTAQMYRQSVQTILRQQSAVLEAQQQVATGKRFASAADDPVASKQAFDLQQALTLNAQYQQNASRAETRLSLEEATLSSSENVLQRIREIVLQANTATIGASERLALASEVDIRLDELLGLANATDANGEYLFGGNVTNAQPFTLANVATYHGDQGQRELDVGPGVRVAVGDPGSSVFAGMLSGNGVFTTAAAATNTGGAVIGPGSLVNAAAYDGDTYQLIFSTTGTYEVRNSANALVTSGNFNPGDDIVFQGVSVSVAGAPAAGDQFTIAPSVRFNVFDTLRELSATLRSSVTDSASQALLNDRLNSALANIDQAQEQLGITRAKVGARLNVAVNQANAAQDVALELQTALSRVEDIDLNEAVSLLNQRLTALDAAQRSLAAAQSLSLFNFLP